MHKNAAAPIIVMLDYSKIDTKVSDAGMETIKSNITKKCQKITEIPMVCWLQHKKKQDFPTKMNGSLLTYLSS